MKVFNIGLVLNWANKRALYKSEIVKEALREHAALLEAESTEKSDNKQMDAISAIEGALAIKDLWRPPDNVEITEDDEHWGEYQALQIMLNNFESVVQKQHH